MMLRRPGERRRQTGSCIAWPYRSSICSAIGLTGAESTDRKGVRPAKPIGAALAEPNDEWIVGRRYLTRVATAYNEASPGMQLAQPNAARVKSIA